MADTSDILKALESLKSEMATKSDLDVIKKDMATKSDLQGVKQAQAQTNTALEALAAGQKDQSTKADIHRLEQKIEKEEELTPPKDHKNSFDLIEEPLNLLEGRAGIDSSNVVCTCAYCVKHPFS